MLYILSVMASPYDFIIMSILYLKNAWIVISFIWCAHICPCTVDTLRKWSLRNPRSRKLGERPIVSQEGNGTEWFRPRLPVSQAPETTLCSALPLPTQLPCHAFLCFVPSFCASFPNKAWGETLTRLTENRERGLLKSVRPPSPVQSHPFLDDATG